MELLEAKDYVLSELVGKNLSYLYPVNYSEEKRKFFEEEDYNPRFVYPAIDFKISRMMNSIRLMANYKGKHSKIINSFAERADLFMKMLLVRASDEFNNVSEELYGLPDNKVIEEAGTILEEVEEEENDPAVYGSKQAEEKLRPAVEKYGWEIRRERILVRIKLSSPEKTLLISSHRKFSESQLERLKVHEIETHIRRASENEKIPGLVRNCFDYIKTEEGLAAVMEEKEGVLSSYNLRKYAARVLAVVEAQESSFSEVFDFVRNFGFSRHDAFSMAAKVKRGRGDTSRDGGLTRDHIYLSGKMEVENYLENGGEPEDLFIGKVGLEDIGKVKQIIE